MKLRLKELLLAVDENEWVQLYESKNAANDADAAAAAAPVPWMAEWAYLFQIKAMRDEAFARRKVIQIRTSIVTEEDAARNIAYAGIKHIPDRIMEVIVA